MLKPNATPGWLTSQLVCCALCATLAAATHLWANHLAEPASQSSAERLREGAHIVNEPGNILPHGDRLVFVRPSGERLTLLENLGLERIARVLDEDVPRSWTVSGRVTEYRGANYLLVERAVSRILTATGDAASAPSPGRIRR